MLTKAEIGNDQIQVRAGINHADLVAGGKVTLTINNGGVNSTVQLTLKADGTLLASNGKSYGYQNGTISWTETTPANGKSLTVTATQTDKAGNVSLPGSDNAQILNEAPETANKQANGQEDAASIAIPTLSGSDIDGNVVSFTIKSLPANGILYLNGVAVTVDQSIAVADAGKAHLHSECELERQHHLQLCGGRQRRRRGCEPRNRDHQRWMRSTICRR